MIFHKTVPDLNPESAVQYDKTDVDGVEDYWWKVELPDGSNAWVFGTQIAVKVKEGTEK